MEQKYIVTKRYNQKAICGDINLPYGTECAARDNIIFFEGSPLCATTSQSAYDYFARNDDNEGLKRGEMTQTILKRLSKDKDGELWEKLWTDERCLKFKRQEYSDHWIWSYDFYNADIEDLDYLYEKVGIKKNDN